MVIVAIASQAWAKKPQHTPATLTLLTEINDVLASTADSEGLSQETLVRLAESVLWTTEPSVDLASSEPTLLSSYSGAKLTNEAGKIAYIAINTSAEATVVSFPDTYSINVPADGFAIRLKNFGHYFSVLEFGGEIVVDGSDFLIATPGTAIDLPYVGNGRNYNFTDSGMNLDSGEITVNGAVEVIGTDGNDNFDFRGLETSPSPIISLDGGLGTDTIYGPNFDNVAWIISAGYSGSVDGNITFENIESIAGGQGSNNLEIESDDASIGSIDGIQVESDTTVTWTMTAETAAQIINAVTLTAINFDPNANTLSAQIETDTITSGSITAAETESTLSGTHSAVITQQDETDTIQAVPVTTITDDTFELTPTSTSDEEPTSTVEDSTSEDSSKADSSIEKSSTNDESGGGSFNLFSLLIFGFLSLIHTRKTKNGKQAFPFFQIFISERLLSTNKYHPSKTKFSLH